MFELTIVTPSKKLVEKVSMDEVTVPAFRGELNIHPGHSPLLSTLIEGVLRYKLEGKSEEMAVAISWGYIEVTPDGVHILAETAESKEEIDLPRAETALKTADSDLENKATQPEDVEKYHRRRRRAEARIAVAKNQFH